MTPDLVVAGGGPAGLATALHAATAGLSVVVREPRAGVVDKACGEGVMPAGVAHLAALGVRPAGREIVGIRYCSPGRSAATRFRGPAGRGVRRTELHRALREAVLDAGVTIEQNRVRELRDAPGGVIVDGVAAGYAVVADGLHSPLRRALGLEARTPGPARYGLRRHVRLAPWTDHVEVHWAAHSEAYVTPVADDVVGVAVLTTRRAAYEVQLADFPELLERLGGAEAASTVRGAGPLRQASRRRVEGRVLLVGDASGYVDALTGEGISLALAQAQAAVRSVVAGDPGAYEREWRRIVRRHRLLTQTLLTVGASPVRPLLVPAAQRLPRVFAAAVNAVGG
ncbi:NAD(P)/FAD-dependent oxidoreductase [Georgenia satyanarayanai]|uniref:NAD(P)/FAD-dependent oxidoreductase n=1 Tax=Georgenia satyanarayanai TaxID=860221 RepID=UPI001264FF11|nr:FAD-dependent monooxygenase [Georgenia satyanarayanai]